jgi:hypothetical protein
VNWIPAASFSFKLINAACAVGNVWTGTDGTPVLLYISGSSWKSTVTLPSWMDVSSTRLRVRLVADAIHVLKLSVNVALKASVSVYSDAKIILAATTSTTATGSPFLVQLPCQYAWYPGWHVAFKHATGSSDKQTVQDWLTTPDCESKDTAVVHASPASINVPTAVQYRVVV